MKMGPRWLTTLTCACALIALSRAAAVGSTTETLVVTRVEDDATTSTPLDGSSDAAPKTEEGPTTDEPNAPIKLTEMDVKSKVSMRYAHTAVVTKVRNPAKKAQEATFRVLLPETAFISGFTMTLDGKAYKAYVKEKEEAKQIYSDAVSQGIGAAHIATKARDSNQFLVSVNVEPKTLAIFNLTYEELLVRRNNVYNHAVNLHPGALVPKLTVTVHIKESQKITTLRVPEVRTGNEIDATEDDPQNSKAVIERCHDDREAIITFSPDLEEQRRLMDVYAEKSKESQSNTRHSWYGGTEAPDKMEGVLGQFVVQYDVDRPTSDGEILTHDGYFAYFYSPPESELKPLPKHVVFVLDTSGSMMDRKITQLREAMHVILAELRPNDYFSIIEFASSVKVYDLKEADEPPRQTTNHYFWHEERPLVLVPPAPATPDNINKAKVIVSRLSANGGTNINDALNTAIDLVQKGVGWTPAATTEATKTTTASNDAPVAEPLEAEPEETQRSAGKTQEAKDNKTQVDTITEKNKADKKLEPIIIFLTDGDPTVGETDPTRIINRITEKNYGVNRASLFSLAFGEDADRKFLRKLSLRNDGFMRHIYEAADAALQLRDFYRQVSSPLLADVHFVYPPDQVKADSVTKSQFRTLYAGSETIVAGRVQDDSREFTPHVYGVCGVDDTFLRKKYEIFPRVPVRRTSNEPMPLERVWAYLTIKQLLDERDAADEPADNNKHDSPEKKALNIALKYEFVTPLTSLVVVKPNDTKAVNAESVDKQDGGSPLALNSGVALSAHAASFIGAPGMAGPPQFSYKAAFSSAIGHVAAPSIVGGLPASLDLLPQYEEAEHESLDYLDGFRYRPLIGSRGMSRPRLASTAFSSPRMGSTSSHYFSRGGGGGDSMSKALHFPQRASLDSVSTAGSMATSAVTNVSVVAAARIAPARRYNRRRLHPVRGGYPTTPYLPMPVSFPSSTTVRPPPPPPPSPAVDLAQYHLEHFSWLNSLMKHDSNTFHIENTNGTSVDLELTKDAEAPKESGGDAECGRAVDGAAGVCVYLTRCAAAAAISLHDYSQTYCQVNNRFAGVCCPRTKVDVAKA